ncbi:MAG TPA: cytochrome P450 [Natronosporangium sp.]
MTDAESLPTLPFRQPYPLQPVPQVRTLHRRAPIHRIRTRVGDEAWLVTGYDLVRQLYSDERVGRAHPRPDRAPRANESALFGGRPRENFATEERDRAWFRELLHGVMGPVRLRELRPWLDGVVTELLDRLAEAEQPADAHRLLAVPLPTRVICKLLGLPGDDVDRYWELTQAIAAVADEQRSRAGLAELAAHVRELLATGRAGSEGLLGQLRSGRWRIPTDTVAGIIASLVFTGQHTTVVAIGYGILLLLTHPDQHRALLADPSRLPAAIEECLRVGNVGINPGGNGIPAYARTDLDIAGVHIRAGDLILLDTGGANHDERVFADPYRFDISRRGTQHFTFGHGRHYCAGAGLARLELRALFGQLLPRFPNLRLATDLSLLRSHDDLVTGGLVALPVRW